MAFACNINRKGRTVRLFNGVLSLIAAVTMGVFWAIPHGGLAAWVVTAIFLLVGAFSIFEATIGWCALRAMGIKTKV
jgi:hypothetical protein